jgi:thioredoxin-related protein
MKKVFLLAVILITAGLIYAFMPKSSNVTTATASTSDKKVDGIKWYSWDEAVKASKTTKKKVFVDVYTEWCGWCKRMDATTFSDPQVAKYINENFYPVKFDAEQKTEIVFDGQTFQWVAGGRNGVHTLAYSLLDGRLGYPSYVYLSENFEKILTSPGYKQVPDLIKELKFVAEGHFSKTSWEDYKRQN